MKTTPHTHRLTHVVLSIVVFALLLFPAHVSALEEVNVPPMDVFAEQLSNGRADELRGVYVPDVLADVIMPQPSGNLTFVSSQPDTVTQFEMAARYGSIALLAHNFLAGADFYELEHNQLIYLVYGDGRTETYIVRQFMRYQALTPNSVTGNFVDLNTGEKLTAAQLFLKVFQREGDLVLQTCIFAEGEPSWGRLFIIAEPYEGFDSISMPARLEFE